MSKRVAEPAGSPSKQPRVGASAGCSRPHGRVVLSVGGTRFESSRTTLECASSYFSALLARWDDDAELFVDGDADAFQPLLSYMRFGKLTLPQDQGLAERVLLQAEYLGMDGLLASVKARAFRNLHPDTHHNEARPLQDAFDAEFGGLSAAIDDGVLPARYFAPVPKAPPARTIKQLWPAAPGYRALFAGGYFDHARPQWQTGLPAHESLHIVSWALVEYRDGMQRVDAIVQRDLDDTRCHIGIFPEHAQLKSHLQLASEYTGPRTSDFAHWVVVPPTAPGKLLPISPGSVRGVWKQPAITREDIGSQICIRGNTIIANSKTLLVEWGGEKPDDVEGATIDYVMEVSEEDSHVRLSGDIYFDVPSIVGTSTELDMAFASVDGCTNEGGRIATKFFIPTSSHGMGEESATQLADAREVIIDGCKHFWHFSGAKREWIH
mmetsp:Transcript_2121/g.6373  ORF Transcript_2121/g.6373 Transcript_2121/m.6373 type:complete len:437 (-) Transcript_2121:57-1367(-)